MPVVHDQRDAQYQMRAIESVPTRATRLGATYRHFCCRGYVRHATPFEALDARFIARGPSDAAIAPDR
jgi:hypothetical protein